MKSQTLDVIGSHPEPGTASCSAYGDPHFSTFDGETDGAHCFGPLGDYDIVKTDLLSIQARYKGRDDSRPEVAVIRGVTISGSLLDEAVISIPPMNFIDHKAWVQGTSTMQGPSILKADNTVLSHSDLVCTNFGHWRNSECFDKKESMISEWMDAKGLTERQAKKEFGKWTRETCSKEKYQEICPKVLNFESFTVRHGIAPRAKVISLPCEGDLTAVQQLNVDKCGHCSCSPNSWIVEVPGVVTIIVNQGTNQGLGITIHDKNGITSNGLIEGQCGNYNGHREDDVFDKWECPYMIQPPLEQLPPGPPVVQSLTVFPAITVMQDINLQANMVVPRERCSDADTATIAEYCMLHEEEKEMRENCNRWCCIDRLNPKKDVTSVCGIDLTLDPVPEVIVQEECDACPNNDDYRAVVEKTCRESEIANGFSGQKLEQHVNDCVCDCCHTKELCPSRGDEGNYVQCLVTNNGGMKVTPFTGDSDVHGNFEHNDYWLMETNALSVQGRFSSSEAKPALTGIALTGYLLGDPRAEEDVADDKWPVIEVKNVGGVSSVEVDGEVHTANFDTNCFSVMFGPQPSVLEAAAPVPDVYLDMLQINASEHAESVLVIVKDCVFDGSQLAGITVNNHADGTQDVMISSGSVLTDLNAGYTDILDGYCDGADGDPVDQSVSLFSVAHPTIGDGCLGNYFLGEDKTNYKCPFKNDARIFKLLDKSLDECFLECSTNDNCEFFSYADDGPYERMCMGCTAEAIAESFDTFKFYQVCKRVTTTTTTTTQPPCTVGYWLLQKDRKCDYQKANRMWRLEQEDELGCYQECASDERCKYFSIGGEHSSHPGICMGCDETTNEKGEHHEEFTFFKVCKWDSDRKTCPKHVHHQCREDTVIARSTDVTDWKKCREYCQKNDQCEWWAFKNIEDGQGEKECEICRPSPRFQGGGKDGKWDTFSKGCDDEAMDAFLQR